MVLLGAGASVFLNKPTTREFKEKLNKKLIESTNNKSVDEEIQILKILNGLLKFNRFEDIEYIFQFLSDLKEIDILKIIKQESIAELYLKGNLQLWIDDDHKRHYEFSDFLDTKLIKVLKSLEDEIFVTYKINENFDLNKLKKVYIENFFKFLEKFGNKLFITTTNYDQIIEESIHINSDHYKLLNGFKYQGQKLIYDEKHFEEIDPYKINIFLLKLHGSLDWKLDKNINKIRILSEVKENNSSHLSNILIYPTIHLKERKEEPFLSLLNKFEEFLKNSDICIIIGFSFRDKYLVDYIKLYFKNRLLIIIDPNPFQCLRNFLNYNEDDIIKGIKLQGIDLFSYQKDDFKFILIKEHLNESNIENIIKNLEYVITENNNPKFWSITWVA